jgi:hypothetical protein
VRHRTSRNGHNAMLLTDATLWWLHGGVSSELEWQCRNGTVDIIHILDTTIEHEDGPPILLSTLREDATHKSISGKGPETRPVNLNLGASQKILGGNFVTSLKYKHFNCTLIIVVNHRINWIPKFYWIQFKFQTQIYIQILIQILLRSSESGQHERCSNYPNLPHGKFSYFSDASRYFSYFYFFMFHWKRLKSKIKNRLCLNGLDPHRPAPSPASPFTYEAPRPIGQ